METGLTDVDRIMGDLYCVPAGSCLPIVPIQKVSPPRASHLQPDEMAPSHIEGRHCPDLLASLLPYSRKCCR